MKAIAKRTEIKPPDVFETAELTEILEISATPRSDQDETGVSINTLLSRKHYAVVHLRRRLQAIYREFLNEDKI